MFVSAYLDAAGRVLAGELASAGRSFALKTLDRMLREAWSEEQGFAHRIGGPELRGSLDDQVFGVLALLDAYEATLDPKYFRAAQRTMDLTIEKYGDAEGGGFFDRASDAPPMGGLDVRRKPFQDSPTPGANSARDYGADAHARATPATGDITIGRKKRSKPSRELRRSMDCSRRPTAWRRFYFPSTQRRSSSLARREIQRRRISRKQPMACFDSARRCCG